MKTFTSFHELDALGEGLSKDYISRTHRWNARCFDIEGFIPTILDYTLFMKALPKRTAARSASWQTGLPLCSSIGTV